jgi:hypothetical protein
MNNYKLSTAKKLVEQEGNCLRIDILCEHCPITSDCEVLKFVPFGLKMELARKFIAKELKESIDESN